MAGNHGSQKATSKPGSQKKARLSTPNKPAVPQCDSRDELQATMSGHNSRRRKRQADDSESEENQRTMSPTKVMSKASIIHLRHG